MPSDPGAASDIRRLHPASLLFTFLGHVKKFFVPVVLLLFFAAGESWQLWLAVFVIPAMIYEAYRYISLRYRFAEGEMIVTEGVIFRNERHIPFARIQNIDLTQSLLQRLCNVAEVRVETASGSEPEAVLKVLALRFVDEMRRSVFAGRDRPLDVGSVEEGSKDTVEDRAFAENAQDGYRDLARMTVGDLFRFGMNPGRGVGLVLVAAGVFWEFDLFDQFPSFSTLFDFFGTASTGVTLLLSLGLALGLLVGFLLLSTAWCFLKLYDFKLQRTGDDFRIQSGLLTRHSKTIPRKRIQCLSIHQSPLHRIMGRVSLKVETAGGTEMAQKTQQWFVPLLKRSKLQGILSEVHGDLDLDDLSWLPLAPKARLRMFKAAVIVSLLITAICLLIFRPWGGLSLFAILPLALGATHLESRFIGYARPPYGILFRNGALYRKLTLTLKEKIQVVSWNQGPFDRRYDMATLKVDTAGAGQTSHKIHVPYLTDNTARDLQQDLVSAAQRSTFSW